MPGWGTVRDYVETTNDDGETQAVFTFVPDDGSRTVVFQSVRRAKGLVEYARGFFNEQTGGVTIRITTEMLTNFETTFVETVNELDRGPGEYCCGGNTSISWTHVDGHGLPSSNW